MTAGAPMKFGHRPDVSDADYHTDRLGDEITLSCGVAWTLISRTPAHAWVQHPRLNPDWEPENKPAFDLGKAAHDLVLGGEARFKVFDAPDWRTNAAREVRDEAYADGKIPILEHQWDDVWEMAGACLDQLEAHTDVSDAFERGKPEQVVVSEINGVLVRIKLDWLPDDGRVFCDYKTTSGSAEPDSYAKNHAFPLGYDFRAAFYTRAISEGLGVDNPQYRLIVQETKPPYPLVVMGFDNETMEMANEKVDAALELWKTCRETDQWPGYPGRTVWLEAPAWRSAAWLERKEMAKAVGGERAMFDMGLRMQAPI